MTRTRHWTLLMVGLFAWLFFYVIGIPSDYFTKWSFDEKILLSLVAFFGAVPVVGGLVLIFLGGDYVRTSFWTAFYTSVPLFVLDYTVEGLHKGEGLHFLITHWYITLAYGYVWVELPLIGLALNKLRDERCTEKPSVLERKV
jgi:hypothetical protein